MAITGSGTQEYPFVVHSYDEIKSVYGDNTLTADTMYYVKLANDIDCKDYGSSFEWETIIGSNWIDFDLDTHEIKNVQIASGHYLFALSVTNTLSLDTRPRIHNGKILNIYGNSGGIFKNVESSSAKPYVGIENLSISIDGSSCTDCIFLRFYIDKCAIYFQTTRLNAAFFSCNISAHNIVVSDSDFVLMISDLNGQPLFQNTNGNSNAYQMIISGCRFKGSVAGLPYYYSMVWNVNQRALFNNARIKVEKTCINIDSTGCALNSATDVLVMISANMTNLGNVNNKDITDSTYAGTNQFDCTSEEIIYGDTLRSNGFQVVNVVGD